VPPTTSLKAALVSVLVVVGATVLVSAPAVAEAESCTIVGTAGDDVLLGTSGDDVICGLGGEDKIVGLGGDDVLRGGGGDDVVRGGPGDDRVAGGRGDDRVFGQDGDDVVRGDAGDDEVGGGPGNDRLGGFRGADDLDGTDNAAFVDILRCGPGPDTAAGDPDDEVKPDCETVNQNDPPTDILLVPSSIPENKPAGTVIGTLTAADPDPGDSHTFTLVAGDGSADNAQVSIAGSSMESAAPYDFEADDQLAIRVRATDEAGESVERALTVTVTDVGENPPVAIDDAFVTPEDTDLVLPVTGAGGPTANDTDADGDPLTVTAVAGATGGSVSIVSGEVRFVPTADLCGDDVGDFDYTVSDGTGLIDQGEVVVDVTCVDDAPSAVADTATVTLNDTATAVDVLANDDNADGGPMAIASASDPANGTVALTGGTPGNHTGLTYEPDADYCNTDPVAPADSFTYTLAPGGDTATVSMTVTCDVPPVAVDDDATVAEDDPATAIDVLANDTNPDGGPKVITAASDPANGTVVLTGPVGARDGLTYEPDDDYCNTPPPFDTFTYTVNGGDQGSVDVTVTCVDDAPVAEDDAATVAEDSGATPVDVLANDADAENDPITIASAPDPANGTVVLTGPVGARDGLTYAPDADYCNTPPPFDTFTYTVNGGDTATVSITVTCVPDAPTLDTSAGTTTYTEDAAPVAVDGNVTITNPDGLAITAGSVTLTDDLAGDVLDWTDNDAGDAIVEGSSTSLQVDLTGTGTSAEWEAALEAVTFATTSQNPSGADRTATFAITTTAGSPSDTKLVDAANVDDPPTADPDAATVLEDAGATAVTVLANDDDVDGGPMQITAVSDPANGTTAVTGGGAGLTYAPDPDYCNDPVVAPDDTFTYTLNSGGAPQTATVSMTVTCVNDAPVADDETFSGATDRAIGNTALVVNAPGDGAQDPAGPQKTITGNILSGDTDVDGPDALGVTPGTIPTNDGGSVLLEADGDFTFLPNPGVSCSDTSDFFDYTVTDGDTPTAGTDVGRVTIEIAECVWYVDQAAAAGGTGRSDAPLDAISGVNAAGGSGDLDGPDDYLFVYSGSTFTGGLPLETNQRLFGQPHGLFVDNVSLVPPAAGTNPNIYNSAAGNGITLANGVEIQRVDAGTAAAKGSIGVRGVGVTTATIGPDTQINSTSVGVALTGAASGDITIDSTIVAGEGNAVGVLDRSGGTVSFTGPVTGVGLNSSVEIRNNTGATVSLTGKVSVSGNGTPANPALWVAGGGTIVASNAANEILGFTQTGVSLDGVAVGAGGVVLGAVTSSGGGAVNGVLANNVSGPGSVTVSGGTLTTSTRGLDVNGGSGDVTIGATLDPTGGRSVEVTNHTGGTVDLNGPVNEDATGVNLSTNTGATIRFDGGLVVDTGTNAAFNATGGGTVVVTGAANTLTTTTGTPLNVVGTSIGGDGLTFRSVSSSGAASGIVLNGTGNVGGLTVTGNGGAGACTPAAPANCTGGAIQSSTGDGISLTATRNPSLTRMRIIDNAGTTADEGIELDNVTGSVTIADSYVLGAPHNSVHLDNNNTNLTGFTMTGTTLKDPQPGTSANGLLVTMRGTSVLTAGSVKGSTIDNAFAAGIQVQTNDTSAVSAFEVGGAAGGEANSIVNNNVGVDMNVSQASDLTFGVRDNSFTGHDSQAINAFAATASTPGATMTGVISNNSVGTANVVDSGSKFGSGIRAVVKGGTAGAFTVDGNTIREVPNARGIDLQGLRTASGAGGVKFRVVNNVVTRPTGTAQDIGCGAGVPCPLASLAVVADNETATDDYTTCAVVSGNSMYDPTSWALGSEAAYYLLENTFTGPSTLNLEGTQATPAAQISSTNTVTSSTFAPVTVDGAVAVVAPSTCGSFPS